MICQRLRRRRGDSSRDKLVWTSRKNIVVTGVPDIGRRYLNDFYTTLIDIQWRWNLLFFVMSFVFTWLVFACYYLLFCFLHGDLDPAHRLLNSTWIPCVTNVGSFTEAYLFSIETMTTIGYGSRYQTEECPGVIMAVMLQSVIGAGLQFALASLVVSKTRRAKTRSNTILFSNTAVVFMEDGLFKLAVRMADLRKGDVIGAHATGMLIKKATNKGGHKVPVRMFTVPFDAESGAEKLFLCWPSLLVHTVDEHSPLWPLSSEDLRNSLYELIVVLDGVTATTSKSFQARKSYHSREILWGRRFTPLSINDDDPTATGYTVNYSTFHGTFAVPVPLCSAQSLERKRVLVELNRLLKEAGLDPKDLEDELLLLGTDSEDLELLSRSSLETGEVEGVGTPSVASTSPIPERTFTKEEDEDGDRGEKKPNLAENVKKMLRRIRNFNRTTEKKTGSEKQKPSGIANLMAEEAEKSQKLAMNSRQKPQTGKKYNSRTNNERGYVPSSSSSSPERRKGGAVSASVYEVNEHSNEVKSSALSCDNINQTKLPSNSTLKNQNGDVEDVPFSHASSTQRSKSLPLQSRREDTVIPLEVIVVEVHNESSQSEYESPPSGDNSALDEEKYLSFPSSPVQGDARDSVPSNMEQNEPALTLPNADRDTSLSSPKKNHQAASARARRSGLAMVKPVEQTPMQRLPETLEEQSSATDDASPRDRTWDSDLKNSADALTRFGVNRENVCGLENTDEKEVGRRMFLRRSSHSGEERRRRSSFKKSDNNNSNDAQMGGKRRSSSLRDSTTAAGAGKPKRFTLKEMLSTDSNPSQRRSFQKHESDRSKFTAKSHSFSTGDAKPKRPNFNINNTDPLHSSFKREEEPLILRRCSVRRESSKRVFQVTPVSESDLEKSFNTRDEPRTERRMNSCQTTRKQSNSEERGKENYEESRRNKNRKTSCDAVLVSSPIPPNIAKRNCDTDRKQVEYICPERPQRRRKSMQDTRKQSNSEEMEKENYEEGRRKLNARKTSCGAVIVSSPIPPNIAKRNYDTDRKQVNYICPERPPRRRKLSLQDTRKQSNSEERETQNIAAKRVEAANQEDTFGNYRRESTKQSERVKKRFGSKDRDTEEEARSKLSEDKEGESSKLLQDKEGETAKDEEGEVELDIGRSGSSLHYSYNRSVRRTSRPSTGSEAPVISRMRRDKKLSLPARPRPLLESDNSYGKTVSSVEDLEKKERQEKFRRISMMEFTTLPGRRRRGRQSLPERRVSIGDLINMYRHRRSITDTYLGTELPESEDSDDSAESAAISSIVSSQRSLFGFGAMAAAATCVVGGVGGVLGGGALGGGAAGGAHQGDQKRDVRDVFKTSPRRKTSMPLFFGSEKDFDAP